MSRFIFKTVFAANAAAGTNALDTFSRQLDQDIAFVQETNRFYRWFATSNAAANGEAVVLPAGANPAGTGRWIRQGPPGVLRNPPKFEVPSDTSYDYTISNRQDLVNIVPPVNGVFELPEGTYKICGNVTLLDDEYLHVGNNRDVLFVGYPGVTITAPSERVVLVSSGTFQNDGVNLQQLTIGEAVLEITAGTVLLTACNLSGGNVFSVEMSGGAFSAHMSRFFGAAGVVFTGGTARFEQCFVAGTEAAVLTCSGATVLKCAQTHFQRFTGDAPNISLLGTVRASFEDCQVETNSDTAAPMVFLQEGADLIFEGGTLRGNVAQNGVGFQLATTADAVLRDVFFEQLDTCVLDSAAETLNRCVLDVLQGSDTVTIGVDWAAARVPTNGLIETALAFNTATPFANHTETDARVNRKMPLSSSGLEAETPIV